MRERRGEEGEKKRGEEKRGRDERELPAVS